MEQYEIPEEKLSRLTDGSLSPQEAAKELLEQEDQKKTASSGGDSASSSAPAEQLSGEEQEIRQLIATMYVLQATYEGKVGGKFDFFVELCLNVGRGERGNEDPHSV